MRGRSDSDVWATHRDSFFAAHINHALCATSVPPPALATYLRSLHHQYIFILGDEEEDGMPFAESLAKAGLAGVAVVNAPFEQVAGGFAVCPCEGAQVDLVVGQGKVGIRKCEGLLIPSDAG